MNPLNRKWFYRGMKKSLPAGAADRLWDEAGAEYRRILSEQPELRKHKGAMVLPAVALYRVMTARGLDAEAFLGAYGESVGRRLAGAVHALTSLPGADRFVWSRAERASDRMSSEKKGYRRRLVSEPPDMYGVDILSCPFHELARDLGSERAAVAICCMDREYSKGFRHIRYERNGALPEGAPCCEYRLRFDPDKD